MLLVFVCSQIIMAYIWEILAWNQFFKILTTEQRQSSFIPPSHVRIMARNRK